MTLAGPEKRSESTSFAWRGSDVQLCDCAPTHAIDQLWDLEQPSLPLYLSLLDAYAP